ncbi:MAG: hypothetical protein H6713_38245 [Myxococcales bacterium]|nr:hypothetical protein [Myxococcales bacterium]
MNRAREQGTAPTVPALLVEQLALGVLPPDEAAAVERRLVEAEGEAGARARLDALQRSNEEILGFHPPERAARVIERRLADARGARSRAGFARGWLAAPAVAAALAVALWVQLGDDGAGTLTPPSPEVVADSSAARDSSAHAVNDAAGEPRQTGVEPTRLKGQDPRLVVHRKRGEHTEELAAGAAVDAGDVLQVSYVAAGQRRGVILSIDGRGAVTLHYPEDAGGSTTLRREGAVPLAHAYELDDAPDFERFIFVTAEDPDVELRVDEITRAARAVAEDPARAREASLELPAGARQQSFLVQKSAR